MAQAMGALVQASLRYNFDQPKRAKARRKPARTAVIPSHRVYRMAPQPSLGRVHTLRPIKADQADKATAKLQLERKAAVRRMLPPKRTGFDLTRDEQLALELANRKLDEAARQARRLAREAEGR